MYHDVDKENRRNRFYIRALARPGCSRGSISTKQYLKSETDQVVTSILDALVVISAQYRNADVNHTFMNFVHTLRVSHKVALGAIAGFIEHHGKRLWHLHVTG